MTAWSGSALTPDQWVVELTPAEQQEIREGRAPVGIADWLRGDLGFVLLRGVPLDTPLETFRMLGRHLGDEVPQNGAGDLVCHIRDTGADAADPDVRLYTTSAEQDFHTDGADLIGLLCLSSAASGGLSALASSITVHDEVARRRPDLVHLLFEDWHWYLHGQQPSEVAPTFAMPICRWDGPALSTFFLGWWIRRAQGCPGVPDLTLAQQELLALYEQVANEPGIALEMDLRPGDMQWLRNSVTLHKRTAYVDDPARPRHLLRLWLAARELGDGSAEGALLRGGFPTSG